MQYESRPAWRYQWIAIVSAILLFVGMAPTAFWGAAYLPGKALQIVLSGIGGYVLYLVLLVAYRRLDWHYRIDGENIESHRGIIARHVRSIRVRDLRNINVNQTAMQRLLGVGDIEFSSAAGGDIEVIFFGVGDPMRVKELVQHLQENPSS